MKKFKKLTAILLASALTLSMATGVLAKGPVEKEIKEKTVEVSLSVTSEQEFEVVYVGDAVELQAITPKHGSSYVDGWVVLDEGGLEVDLDVAFDTVLTDVEGVNSYVSTATFVSEEAGTFTLKYNIEMAAGKSHVTFNGNAESDEIVVVDPDKVYITGVTVKDHKVSKQGNTQNVTGKIFFTMSEGENVFYDDFSVTLNNSHKSRTVEVSAENKTYIITITENGWDYTVE